MKRIAAFVLLLILIAGCESKEEREQLQKAEQFKQEELKKVSVASETAEKAAPSPEKLPSKKSTLPQSADRSGRSTESETNDSSTLKRMGVSMEDGRLIIDTHKTRAFFDSFRKRLDNGSKRFDRELKEGNLTVTVPVGVEVKRESLSIDLNKTRSFFDGWGQKIEAFEKEFAGMTQAFYEHNQSKEERE